jgi:S1-C subfamily serine protease
MKAKAHTRGGRQALGRGGVSRYVRRRSLGVVVVALVATVLASGVALARGTAARIGNGVVVIKTTLAYESSTAAGTGMVLTSSGEILTNNHVIRGATKITVLVPGTNDTYTARVVGYDVADDVAVLRATGASNLATVTTGESSKLVVGDHVTAVGNAGGTGTLSTVAGTLTQLQRSIVVSDDSGGSARLTGLIGTNAGVVPGDSGGPLLDSSGAVIGMTTAGSTGYVSRSSTDSQAYAIPIAKALSIAGQIDAGHASARIHIGATSFVGVEVASVLRNGDFTTPGAVIAGVLRGSPAAAAGIQAGDVITAIDGHAVSTSSSITTAILAKKPGAKATIRLADRSGAVRSVTVTLTSGPAQ